MMNISKQIRFLFLVLVMAACQRNATQTEVDPTETAKTRQSLNSFNTTATIVPAGNPIITPNPDQQVYTDPEGWYAVNFPADLQPTDKENYFTKDNSFFETGYLPEMGTMSGAAIVCAWLANVIDDEPQNLTINWMPSGRGEVCSISTRPEVYLQVNVQIFENPGADSAQRFAYVKTGWPSPNNVPGWTFQTDFSWLKPTDAAQNQAQLSPVTPEILNEWGKTLPILQDVSIIEYPLPPGSDPYRAMLFDSLPHEARPDMEGNRCSEPQPQTAQDENPTLESLGYELKTEMIDVSSGQYPRTRLYRDGRLLFDYVYQVSDIYSFTTTEGSLVAFVVTTRSIAGQIKAFLIQNDAIIAWDSSHQDPPFAPILVQDRLLWLKVSQDWDHVQVIKSDSEANEMLYSFVVYTEPMFATNKFVSWNGHWVWAARDFLIQDGEIINEKLGFQEIFEWRLIDDTPAYFFRKDGRTGFSYHGQIIPLEYQNVARNLCCGYAVNNPAICKDRAHFFAQRDGTWYYVVLKFNS
jgi:hypothetical protein